MSFCPNCGKKVEGDEAYCSQCGNELVKQETEQRQIARIQEELKDTRLNEWGSGVTGGILLVAGIVGIIAYNVLGLDYDWIIFVGIVFIMVGVVFAIISGIYGKKCRDLKKRL